MAAIASIPSVEVAGRTALISVYTFNGVYHFISVILSLDGRV